MQNKLKDVFSNKRYEFGVSLLFKDPKSKEKFMESLKVMESEGKAVNIEGVSEISTNIKDGNMSYPLLIENDISSVTVGPVIKHMPVKVDTEYGKKTIDMENYSTYNGFVIKTGDQESVFLKFNYNAQTETINFVYRMQPEFAKRLEEITEKLAAAISLINSMFKTNVENGVDSVAEIRKRLQTEYKLLKKLNQIEENFNILFDTSKISGLSNSDIRDIEEVYALMVEKKAVRLNGRLKSTETTGINFKPNAKIPEVGSNIDLTFTNKVIYSICGQDITIYTANILLNAVVKEILTDDNGEIKVLYGDEDRKPMYISYTGFKTEDEAKKEFKAIMQNKPRYVEALMVS